MLAWDFESWNCLVEAAEGPYDEVTSLYFAVAWHDAISHKASGVISVIHVGKEGVHAVRTERMAYHDEIWNFG